MIYDPEDVWWDSGRFVRFQAKNKMKKCRKCFTHIQISLWKSSLSLKTPLLCLRPPFDKLWEKLNFKFDHFLCKCLSLWNWNTMTAALSVFWWSLQLFPGFWLRYLSFDILLLISTNIYWTSVSCQHHDIFMKVTKMNALQLILLPSKRYQYSRCLTEMDSIAIQQISCNACIL